MNLPRADRGSNRPAANVGKLGLLRSIEQRAGALVSTTHQVFVVHHDDFRIPATHPSLAGHFPGNPVVPGVVLLDEVAAALRRHHGRRIAGFSQVKFVAPLLPEQTAVLQLELTDERLRFRVLRDDVLIASGEANTA